MPSNTLPDMPGFIPIVMREFTKKRWPEIEKDSELAEVYCRLITDQQMKTVYETVLKYEDKVKPSFRTKNDKINPENNPIIEFVWQALLQTHFAESTKPISKPEYKKQLQKMATLLKKLNFAIERFPWKRYDNFSDYQEFGYSSITRTDLSDALQDFKGFIDDASNQTPLNLPKLVTTNLKVHTQISYMRRMSGVMMRVFQRPLDNVVAITTNVALDLPADQVDGNSVRRHRQKRTIPSKN